jgi:hypothetical protein
MKINAEHGCARAAHHAVHAASDAHPLGRQVILVQPNSFLHDQRFAQGADVTMETVSEGMAAGDTLLIHNLEIYWKSVGGCASHRESRRETSLHLLFCAGAFSEMLSEFFNLYVQVNLYFSPAGTPVTVSAHQDAQVPLRPHNCIPADRVCALSANLPVCRVCSSSSLKARKHGVCLLPDNR